MVGEGRRSEVLCEVKDGLLWIEVGGEGMGRFGICLRGEVRSRRSEVGGRTSDPAGLNRKK